MTLTKHVKKLLHELFDFSLVGVTSFGLRLFLTIFLTELFGVGYRLAYAIGLFVGYGYQFILNMKLTFTVTDNHLLRIERFIVVAAIMAFLNWSAVVVFTDIIGVDYVISIIIVSTIMSLLNFEMEEVWVFKEIPRSKHHRLNPEHALVVRKSSKDVTSSEHR